MTGRPGLINIAQSLTVESAHYRALTRNAAPFAGPNHGSSVFMPSFSLHPQLALDCHPVGDLALSQVLLLNDRRYPWVILVPRRAGIREIYELATDDRIMLLAESCRVGRFLMAVFDGTKLNVGALGNLVPQLHLHHVVRQVGDPAWPGPVWGHSAAAPYRAAELAERIALLRKGLAIDA
ncbi:MAG: HIT family protein [Chromatiaceae bacterium]|nr:HIT family protein [Chromatiaceae bacterium]